MKLNWRTAFIASALVVTLPMAQVSALSVAELGFPAIYVTSSQAEESMTIFAHPPVNIQQEMNVSESPIFDFVVKDQAIELTPMPDELGGLLEKELSLGLEKELSMGQDDEIFPPDIDIEQAPVSKEHFWTKKKVFIATGVLLTTGLLFGVLAFALSGSGSGSGSGSSFGGGGGVPNNPNPDDPSDPDDPLDVDDPIPPLTCPDGGDCIPDDGGGPIGPPGIDVVPLPDPNGIPHSPEPATFLLFGLGLFLPLLRRKTS